MLSAVICTYNEEKNLKRAVDSVKTIADEIVVVDTESNDKTVELAKNLGCKVFHHKNTGIVEPVRNFAISKAKGDWILLIDADEEVSDELAREITKIKTSPQADHYRIPRQNIIFGKWIKSDHWWPDYTYRLFKKGSLVWLDQIHSLPKVNGKGIDLQAYLIHHNYQTISQFLKKLDTYTDFQTQELISGGFAFSWTDLITKPFSEFVSQLFVRKGLGDGLHGLALSGLQAFSEFIVYLKIWQYHHFAQKDISPQSFRRQLLPLQKELDWWQTEYQLKSANIFKKLLLKIVRKYL